MTAQSGAQPQVPRRLQAKTVELREAILEVMQSYARIRVRALCYRLVDLGVIPKTEKAFDRVERTLVDMRRDGIVPYDKIAEGHRERAVLDTFADLGQFLGEVKNSYYRDVWAAQPYHVEVWVEKDGLADIVQPICDRYRVHYVATKGQPSLTLLYTSAREMIAAGKKTILLYFGDFDATGLNIGRTVERELQDFGVELDFRRVAVTLEQIGQYGLLTRPGKQSDNKHAAFVAQYGDECVELDALESVSADTLPSLVRQAIEAVIDRAAWTRELEMERVEDEQLGALVQPELDGGAG
jgi:hypothetical protein